MSFVQGAYAALIPLLLVAGAAGLYALRAGRFAGRMRFGAWLTTSAILAVWIVRWVSVGHLPLFGTYENALSLALATMSAAVWWEWRQRMLAVTPAASLVAALLLAQGIQFDAMPYGLTISERSLFVDVHAVLAWLAFGVLVAAFALATRLAFGSTPVSLGSWLQRTTMLGFVLHTAMIVSGSLYKFMLFGQVWTWDPIETMALIAWLSYGTLLHMSLLAGWGARRVARWSIGTFVVLVVSYRAIVYFPAFATYHIFDIGLKLHR